MRPLALSGRLRAPASASPPGGFARRRLGVVALALAVAACSGGDDDGSGATGPSSPSSSTPLTAPAERATAAEVPLAVGQCGDVATVTVGAALDPAAITTVACDQVHTVEVIAVFEYPAGSDLGYPGAASVDRYASDECIARFDAYVGRPYVESALDVAFASPSEDGWDDGDRRLACVAYHADFAPLTGSVAGSGL